MRGIGSVGVMSFERLVLFLTFLAGFAGSAIFVIDLGLFSVFPFRVLLMLFWGLFAIRVLLQGKIFLPLGKKRLYMAFGGIWMAYSVVSLAWAVSKFDAVRHLIFLFMGISLIFFAIQYFRGDRDIHWLYWIWFIVFFGLIILGLWEHLTGRHLPVSGYHEEKLSLLEEYVVAQVRNLPTGVFNNPNDYATFLALSIPFALSTFRYVRSKLVRLTGLGLAVLSLYFIVVIGSRGNILAVLLELIFIFLFLTNINQKVKVVVAGLACLGLVLIFFSDHLREFFFNMTWQILSIVEQSKLGIESVAVRVNLVRNGLAFLYSTAGFGVGAGNAEYWMENFQVYDTQGITNPHNWWLEILVDYGVFILIGYVTVYLGLLRGLWHRWRKAQDRGERMIAEALLVALIGFSVASISSSSIMAFNPQWMLFAFSLAFLNLRREGS